MTPGGAHAQSEAPPVARRAVLSFAAGLCLPAAGCQFHFGTSGVNSLFGQPLDSVSVQFAAASHDGLTQVQLYHCAFPKQGVAWNWAHLLTHEGLFAAVDNTLFHHDGAQALAHPQSLEALYTQPGPVSLRLARNGPAHAVASASASASGRLRRIGQPRTSSYRPRRSVTMTFNAILRPSASLSGLQPGRVETFGHVDGDLTIDGRALSVHGPGKIHEQLQASPRFATPFVYATLWGERRAFSAIFSNDGNGGVLADNGGVIAIKKFEISPPSPERALALHLADGTILKGVARSRADYEVPVFTTRYPHQWPVLVLDGEPLFGDIGDFRKTELAYPPLR